MQSAQSTAVVDDLVQTWRSTAQLASSLRPEQWDTPTELPGWTVRDVVAHMASIEAFLLGRSEDEHEAADAPHVRNPLGAWNEQRVDRRRAWPVSEVLAEFEDVTRTREPVLRGLRTDELEAMVFTPLGNMPLERFLHVRLLDSWLHEQEIRRALGVAETLDTRAAERVVELVLEWLPRAAAKAGLGPGDAAVIEITGAMRRTVAAAVKDGRGVAIVPPPNPAIRVRGEVGPFLRCATGRLAPAEAIATRALQIDGDPALAERLLLEINRVP